MDEKQRQFAKWLAEQARDHAEWGVVMRFGMETLLQDQPFLFQLITAEMFRELTRAGVPADADAQIAKLRDLLAELHLRLVTG